ncbi:conserved hypothetical protein [Thiomonas arsenitoxydans]|jgi:hypothetical protein|uniref:Uncharacterized protein n=1 Tax=Thiomonas arsenitoxydans (strain DSM 22701 / CIP 110005 / 3As) TaxID=426114 RepID=D6CT16_THIA3|nr:hypothetical protein [Thiomonas arsenitoxydans]CAZ88435.1 hypothetical protein THI_1763 [Thiomonas arsenitoxydans]CQR33242.1 conserved hypothetical protein [Thiomonas arsenitoxydans]CQR33612.1 conserved hypothetical protein [Thiomonas arsenitoxydans]CQR33881.1 conserved hypothetical protein [Thiomonas arsenitoxydans]CQR39709.1 conserved hypothetical protein [Thiomonas arsenitoxydans]
MAIILPDAQDDLLSLQDYMLDQWGESAWGLAEDEIFEKLHLIETGFVDGSPIPELAAVGITIYKTPIHPTTNWSINDLTEKPISTSQQATVRIIQTYFSNDFFAGDGPGKETLQGQI